MMTWCIIFSSIIVIVHLFTPVPEQDQFSISCSCCGVGSIKIDAQMRTAS